MNYVKYAAWAVVAFFLFRLWGAKKRGMSTPDALRSQIPFVGDFLARAAEHPPTDGSGASTASIDIQSPGPGAYQPDNLIQPIEVGNGSSIMGVAPRTFVAKSEPHPVVASTVFNTDSFVSRGPATSRPPTLAFEAPSVQSFVSSGGAAPAAAPYQVTSQQRLWLGLGAGSPVFAAPTSSLAAGAKGIFGS
jgi:hypothetical protein